MKTYINGNFLGICKTYCQYNKILPGGRTVETGWKFFLENGMELSIPHSVIRLFNSCGKIDITLQEGGAAQ